jgi:hypothetical protein
MNRGLQAMVGALSVTLTLLACSPDPAPPAAEIKAKPTLLPEASPTRHQVARRRCTPTWARNPTCF